MRGAEVEAAGIDPGRVAELIVTPAGPGPERRGSGYRVSSTSVLTAAHVVGGAARVRVRCNADRPGEWVADATVAWADPGLDTAVLELPPPAGEGAVEPVGFGRVGERDAVITASAMGFPRFKLRQDQGGPSVYRDSAHAVGTVAVLANRRQGTLEVTVDPPERDPDPARSPWEGMSGAALWSGGRVIGLVAEHHRSDGLGRLAATRVDACYERVAPERLERLRDLLGLPARPDGLPDVVPAPASELLQAGYLAQVRDLAPERLLEREAELEELVEFCAGEERYRWLRGPPWAGKSALAAWFVLHPPAGVTVVSFFVTRRLAGQTDSNAFTEAVVEQLAAVAGEPVAGSATPAGRDKARRHLLSQAARRVAERGQRLLLLVDGLDEDQGAKAGSGLPSIASLLPERPPEAVRVLVTSRPHPGIPDDVAGDHPLRHCQPRLLAPSRAARHIEVAAKDELFEQLHGDPVQVDLLGLLTAGGGGFTLSELSLLSGQPGWALAGKLRSVFGRSLMARAPYDQPAGGGEERVLLFAHETLRVIAEQELAGDLGGYRARIDAWVDELRERGWPEDTPQYPLRPYGRLLAARGELGRLVELATDPRRQERLLVATAGDGAAIAELTAAQHLALEQPLPDLEALGRLAVHKDRLAGRNQAVPVGLPALWVRLGQRQRGEALARSLPDAKARAEALSALAEALAVAGQWDRAEATARGIADPAIRAAALGGVAKILAGRDRPRAEAVLDDAERTARDIPPSHIWRSLALGAVAEAQADAGLWQRAERTLRDLPPIYAAVGDRALRSVARALAGAGQWDGAEATARSVLAAMVRAEALASVGAALLAVDRDRGLALLEEAERWALQHGSVHPDDAEPLRAVVQAQLAVDPGREPGLTAALQRLPRRVVPIGQAGATRMVAKALAGIGRWDRAEEAAAAIAAPGVQAEAWRDLAEALASAGRWDDAERTARGITLSRVRSEALVAVATSMAALERERALGLANEAEQLARQLLVGSQDWAWHDLAGAQAAIARWDLAEATAAAIPDPFVRGRALAALVRSLAGAGHWDRAERTARALTGSGLRAEALAAVAEALARADRDRALALAEEAQRLAGQLPDDDWREQEAAMRSVTLALAGAGELERAARTAFGMTDHSLSGASSRSEALAGVVEALADAGAWDQAKRVALGIPDPPDQVRALATVAKALGRVDRPAALVQAAEAERMAMAIDDSYSGGPAARAVAEIWAALGRWNDAERQVGGLLDLDSRDEARLGLVETLRDGGDLDRAELAARAVEDPARRACALAALLGTVTEVDRNRVDGLAAEAERLARAIDDPVGQADAYLAIAASLTSASRIQRAAPDDPLRARAHRLLGALLAGPTWSEALVPLARVQPSALAAISRALDQVGPA